jgi:predicted porin
MKKLLIASAALAMVAGTAQAQSSVTLYGVVDAGYSDVQKTYGAVDQSMKAFTFSNYTTSRWGIRGTEDLGGGLTASFTVESGMSSDVMAGYYQTGTSAAVVTNNSLSTATVAAGTAPQATTLGDRALFATIANKNSGTTVGLGFASTSIRDNALKFDAAGGSRLVGNFVTMDAQLSSNRATGVSVTQNVANGLSVSANFLQNESKTDTADTIVGRNGYGFALNYAQGAVEAGYARQEVKSTGNNNSNVRNSEGKQTIDILGASYDLKAAKVFVAYANIKVDDSLANNAAVTGLNTTAGLFTGEGKRNFTSVGVSVPFGKTTAFATVSEGSINQATTAGTAGVKRDMSGYTVGARYALSKRTFAYAAVGEAKIDATSGTTNRLKVEQTTLGMAHSF